MRNFPVQRRVLRVLPKGQITIPLPVRRKFYIEPNDIIELIPVRDMLVLKLIKKERINFVKDIRTKEWERYKGDIEKALLRLSKLPRKKLPKLCR